MPNGSFELSLVLAGDEASDRFNFVLKDESTNTWYDHYNSNFVVPLRLAATQEVLDIPELPQELSNIWAYIKWEASGSPHRTATEASVEYQVGIC
jgi:hypothetical protein